MGAVLTFLAASVWTMPTASQDQDGELRSIHELAAFATVRISSGSSLGTGWLLRQSSRPLIITNRHIVPMARGRVRVGYYQGSDRGMAGGTARPVYVSRDIDLSVLIPEGDIPATARGLELETGDVVRGQRIVLGGNPHGMLFQTSEGVVTGHAPEHDLTRACGLSRNCVAVDAASFGGSSGGPALNRAGRVVGMLWGAPISRARGAAPVWVVDPTFAFLIHARVIQQELDQLRERQRR